MQESAGIFRGPEPWGIGPIVWAPCYLSGCLQVRMPFLAGTRWGNVMGISYHEWKLSPKGLGDEGVSGQMVLVGAARLVKV